MTETTDKYPEMIIAKKGRVAVTLHGHKTVLTIGMSSLGSRGEANDHHGNPKHVSHAFEISIDEAHQLAGRLLDLADLAIRREAGEDIEEDE